MKGKTVFDGQNERDQYLTRQPLDVLHVEERNIILLFALQKTTTVGMLVIIEPQHLNAWHDSTILGLLSLLQHDSQRRLKPTERPGLFSGWCYILSSNWLSGVKFRLENCPDLYNQQLTWAGSWGHSLGSSSAVTFEFGMWEQFTQSMAWGPWASTYISLESSWVKKCENSIFMS